MSNLIYISRSGLTKWTEGDKPNYANIVYSKLGAGDFYFIDSVGSQESWRFDNANINSDGYLAVIIPKGNGDKDLHHAIFTVFENGAPFSVRNYAAEENPAFQYVGDTSKPQDNSQVTALKAKIAAYYAGDKTYTLLQILDMARQLENLGIVTAAPPVTVTTNNFISTQQAQVQNEHQIIIKYKNALGVGDVVFSGVAGTAASVIPKYLSSNFKLRNAFIDAANNRVIINIDEYGSNEVIPALVIAAIIAALLLVIGAALLYIGFEYYENQLMKATLAADDTAVNKMKAILNNSSLSDADKIAQLTGIVSTLPSVVLPQDNKTNWTQLALIGVVAYALLSEK